MGRLTSLFYTLGLAVAMTVSCVILFGLGGLILAALIGIVIGFAHVRKSMSNAAPFLIVLFVLFASLFPAICRARNSVNRMICCGHLKAIGCALHQYHETYKCFPPAFVADKDGRPMHSWRVLILPFLYETALYEKYRFDEPWDGPNNRQLLKERSEYFVCPGDSEGKQSPEFLTNCVAVVGKDAAWPVGKPRRLSDPEVSEKTGSTVMVVEALHTGISWSEPRDLSLDELRNGNLSQRSIVLSSEHPRDSSEYFHSAVSCVNAAMMDTRVDCLPATGCADGSLLRIGNCDYDVVQRSWRWPMDRTLCIGFVVFVVSTLLLLYQAARHHWRQEESRQAGSEVAS
jgi:hypothetical protein